MNKYTYVTQEKNLSSPPEKKGQGHTDVRRRLRQLSVDLWT